MLPKFAFGMTLALLALTTPALTTPVHAAESDYPTRPVRMVMPFPLGGALESLARLIGDEMTKAWGQPVLVDSRPGAAGSIGSQQVARSAPDGYTILFATQSTHTVNPLLFKDTPYDPFRDFEPITMVASGPLLLLVNPKLPVNDVAGLIAHVKASPTGLNYASSSAGSSPHLAAEMFKRAAALDLVHVPYKGSGPAKTDVVAGHVLMMFDNVGSSLPAVQAGQLRALAVTGSKRSQVTPELPTMIEAGFPDVVLDTWYALYAPSGTPRPIVDKLRQESVRILQLPHIAARLKALGVDPIGSTPEELTARMRADMERYRRVIQDAGIKAQ